MARTTTGVDVGLRTTKVLRGHYKGNTFHATGFACHEHGTGDVAGGWEGIAPRFKPTAARVGLSGRDVNIRYVRVPRVPDWQLKKLMRFEVAEIGDQSGAEVASDFNLLPELPEIEGEDVVLLAMARESLLAEHLEGLRAAGGTLDAFSPSSLALYNAWIRFGAVQDETVLLADIGHDNIDVVIARGPDLLFARNMSGGSRLFDDAIAARFNVPPEQAEKLKRELATLRSGASYATPNHERASRAILGAAGQLLSLLGSTLLFCKSQVKVSGLKLDRALLCGGGAALDGLTSYLAAGMSVPVELFQPLRVVDVTALPEEEAELLTEYDLESVVALGLATMASDPDAYSIEILPERTRKQRAFLGGTLWMIAAGVLAVAYLGYFGVHSSKKLDEVRAQSASVAAQLKSAQSTHTKTVELAEENVRLSKLGDELEALAGSGEQVARVLGFLDRALPNDFWVQRLIAEPGSEKELGLPQGTERPVVELKGSTRAGTDSPAVLWQAFIGQLQKEMPGVQTLPSFSPTGDSFSLSMTLYAPPQAPAEPEAEAVDDGAKKGS